MFFFCFSIGWLVCQLVSQSVCHNFLKGMFPTRVAEPGPTEPAISVGAGAKIGEWSESGQDYVNGRSLSQNQNVKLELEGAKTKKYTFQLKTCVEMKCEVIKSIIHRSLF